ncbi:NAD(P)H-binding protein [Thalassotalea piscium]
MNATKIIMMGATGAVGNEVVKTLLKMPKVAQLTLIGRRPVENIDSKFTSQHSVDIFNTNSYKLYLAGHNIAICTLGVGQPSKISKEEFVSIDKDAVLSFASACKQAGISHFQLLSSVGADSTSSSFYLRTKGELEDGLKALGFARLSLFHPSMIITPTNRYGLSQAFFLSVMPLINPLLIGSLSKFRSIKVEALGQAIALNIRKIANDTNVEDLYWRDFIAMSKTVEEG